MSTPNLDCELLQGLSERGERSESPIQKDSPAESQGKRHHISAPSGPSSMHGSTTLKSDNLDVAFAGPERKVSRVQKGKYTY